MHFYVYFIEPDVNVDDLVLVEGDILLSKEQAAIYYESGWDGLVKSESWRHTITKWNTRIPYLLDITIVNYQNDNKIKAITKNIVTSNTEITDRSCVSLEYKKCTDKTYINFVKGDE